MAKGKKLTMYLNRSDFVFFILCLLISLAPISGVFYTTTYDKTTPVNESNAYNNDSPNNSLGIYKNNKSVDVIDLATRELNRITYTTILNLRKSGQSQTTEFEPSCYKFIGQTNLEMNNLIGCNSKIIGNFKFITLLEKNHNGVDDITITAKTYVLQIAPNNIWDPNFSKEKIIIDIAKNIKANYHSIFKELIFSANKIRLNPKRKSKFNGNILSKNKIELINTQNLDILSKNSKHFKESSKFYIENNFNIKHPSKNIDLWNSADIRINLSGTRIEAISKNYKFNQNETNELKLCNKKDKSVWRSSKFKNYKEGTNVKLLEIDVLKFLQCQKDLNKLKNNFTIFLSASGRKNGDPSVGVRLRNINNLSSLQVENLKLSIVTDRSLYTIGDINNKASIPLMLIADNINILSNSWNDDYQEWWDRTPKQDTNIHSAIITGDNRANLENVFLLHEIWVDRKLNFLGSILIPYSSLDSKNEVKSDFPQFTPAELDFDYDESLFNLKTAPPLSIKFTIEEGEEEINFYAN